MTVSTAPVPVTHAEFGEAKPSKSAWRVYLDILSTIMTVLLVMVAAVAVVISIATHYTTNNEYTVFGHPVMTVLSGSMTPVIRTGDLIVDDRVSSSEAQHLRVGQVASFRESPTSRSVITHRIVGVRTIDGQTEYLTKGDANESADSAPRPASDVVGVFSYAIPRGGYVLNALHQPLVLVLLLASTILWFVAGPLYAYARKPDQGDGPRDQGPATDAGAAKAVVP